MLNRRHLLVALLVSLVAPRRGEAQQAGKVYRIGVLVPGRQRPGPPSEFRQADTTPAVRAAKDATTTIPIVMANVSDPIGSGLIESFARPGGNVTGSIQPLHEVNAKALEMIRQLLPNARRLAMMIDPASPAGQRHAAQVQQNAKAWGMTVAVMRSGAPRISSATPPC